MAHRAFTDRSGESDAGELSWGGVRERRTRLDFRRHASRGSAIWTHRWAAKSARDAGTCESADRFAKGAREGIWFLANPVDGVWRPNAGGNWSLRSQGNITSFRYLVLESDRADISEREWLAFLAALALPVAAIVETGRRLAHALIRVDAKTKAEWDHVKDKLAPLLIRGGADPDSLTAVRLTRLPGCERLGERMRNGVYHEFADGPHVQRLLYLNPQPTCTPITAMQEAAARGLQNPLKEYDQR